MVGPAPAVKPRMSSVASLTSAADTIPVHPGTVTAITVPGGPDVGLITGTGASAATAAGGTGVGGSSASATPGATNTPRLVTRAPAATSETILRCMTGPPNCCA